MKGVAKTKPPRARYETTWDPSVVTSYLKTLWPHSNLSLLELTKKCITLLKIRIENIVISGDKMEIFVPDQLKSSRPGRPQPCLVLSKFREHPWWCTVTCVQDYLERTSAVRKDECLFVGVVKPHKSVGSQTISRWIKATLKDSGIDTAIFSAHSVRHSSTSSAFRNGVEIEEIRRRAGWAPDSATFARFYNRPVLSCDKFVNSVFSVT
jgi:hypothetical protein